MSTVIKTKFEVLNTYSFLERFDIAAAEELYIGIGKSAAWTDDNLPPNPVDSVQEAEDFWTNMIGIQKIVPQDMSMMVPRIDWTVGIEYFLFDKTDPNAYDTDFYVMSTLNNYVYKLETKVGNPTAVSDPGAAGHNSGAIIDTLDGYTWSFMYDLSLLDTQNLISPGWIPVNYGDNLSADQTSFGDVDAIRTLGAKYVITRAKLEDTGLPVDITYRQIALIANPIESDGSTPATASIYLKAALELNSGDLIHLENRRPVTRSTGQAEEANLVLEF